MHASVSPRRLRVGSDDAALDAAPDPQDLPAVISFSCLSKSLLLHLHTQLHHICFQTRHLPRQHSHLPLESIKSRCHGAVDRIHFRIRLRRKLQRRGHWRHSVHRSLHHCEGGCCGPVGLLAQILCTVFFESVELPELSTPGVRLQGSSISHGSCADSSSAPGVAVSGSRYRDGVNSGSSSVGEQDTHWLAVPAPQPLWPRQYSAHINIPQIHCFTQGKTSSPSPPQPLLSHGLSGVVFWTRSQRDQTTKLVADDDARFSQDRAHVSSSHNTTAQPSLN